MGSTSAENNGTGVGRRDLIKRSAALGLVSVPAMGFLSACASGGGDDQKKAEAGEKSAKNPLAVNESAKMEFVLFDGGFGKEYAEDAVKLYEKAFPKAEVKFSATQKIQSTLQPRFNGGNPPDLVDNSGAEQMDMGVLVGKKQLADLTPLLDAPSYDDPNKKVRDTLRPGIVEMGQFDGDPVWILYYAYTVYGNWYSQKALDSLDAEYPKTWDEMLAVCAKAKKKGMAGWTYAGKYPYYIPFSMSPMIAKVGGVEVLNAIDNLEPNAWKHPAVKTVFEAWYELFKKGYVLKGTPGLDHIQSQTAWAKGDALFIPNGSWVENESAKVIPADFDLAVSAPPGIDDSDKMPFGTMWASGGEPFIVPAKAANGSGGMEQLRIMLSEASSKNFTSKVKSLSAYNGGTDGIELTPGLKSGVAALELAGDNVVNPRMQDWYVQLQKEKIGVGCLGEMMAGRMTPAETIKKIQGYADEAAKDSSIKHYKHQ
ncbi:N-acetylglucosamine/diacetylchitobiose ABC transporter substrate-binding protein [Streptomyces coelicoflavus]|uniref:Carbohydrate ABC transporter, N-acetylglucosamine/diacetylchitobiose-binding protein n=1 Tax=Streptomyces coelicoflavus TaxID=285562 RepID=A0A6N9V120_9ACTN|nr:N-acetylglucosamine/diacetylchitobiose ABC transporter substrate-binding protein [Streptomyces coelicoflavus]EHN75301.1 putative ABC transporter solute-binding protein [Streptomyces coelicoflavus ZG0656]KPC71930.1 ABC transporter substrate-binding protein [Streptomyces sp. NRRL WC-3753]MZE45461.1 carbohydrate ABC transporter, N-acetylglucosamine/diacetylchitobiose-binding protein [Streptomyces sp. SID5477]NEB22239.1 carbohydrate ABC transporter, N-acetylglucosamine/diacetylchitobiose-binding